MGFVLGLIVGLILGGPILGILGGLGLGAIYGRVADHGIDDKFLKSVAGSLKPKTSVLLVLAKPEDYDGVLGYLNTFEIQIDEAELDEDAQKAIIKASEDSKVKKALEVEYGDK